MNSIPLGFAIACALAADLLMIAAFVLTVFVYAGLATGAF